MHVLSDFSTIGFNELKNRPKWRKKPNSSTSTGLQKDTFADINRNAIVQKKMLGKPFLEFFFFKTSYQEQTHYGKNHIDFFSGWTEANFLWGND